VNVDGEGLYQELRKLCQGKGVRERYLLRSRIGPQLQHVCRVADHDTDAATREKAIDKLDALMGAYPERGKKILRAVLGMHAQADSAVLDRRLEWLASECHCSKRTMYREFAKLLRMLAEDAVAVERAAAVAEVAGYKVETLHTRVTFAGRRATITERRKIRAIRRLEEIRCRYGSRATAHGGEPDVKVVHGGRLISRERQRAGEGEAIAYRIEPVPRIEAGDVHELEVEYPYPDEQPMPHYVVQPITTFGSFSLDLRFDPAEPPDCVWRVDGVGHKEVDIVPPVGHLRVDPVGRIEVITFHWIRQGGSYGVAWEWKRPSQ
jgi:hypothetical protein